jgi:glucosamine--fructose-6-phosphate aminotransferase (isomerizing)
MAGEQTRAAIFAQPEWLRGVADRVGDRRLPDGRVVYTGCGTSFHAAMTGGEAIQALELVLRPPQADVLVCVSHEGETRLTIEAAKAFKASPPPTPEPGRHRPVWLVTAKAESPLAKLADEVVVATPEVEQSWCHTASYTSAVAALAALRGEDVSWLAAAVSEELTASERVSEHERFVVAGAGRDLATAHEAVLKLREGAWVAAEAYETEQLLHGYLAAVDEGVRAFVLEGEGRAAERADDARRALETLGADTTLVQTRHPVVDIVQFQLLTLALAGARGAEPDRIRRDDERWAAAAKAASASLAD